MPWCDHTGVPIHFHSSTTSGSASWMSARTCARRSPRQSESSRMRASMCSEADFASAAVLPFGPMAPSFAGLIGRTMMPASEGNEDMGGVQRWFPRDLVAGLVLTTMLVPVGIAYAVVSGVPGIYGLYATIVPLFAYALFGPSKILVLGPDSSLAPVILTVVL